MKKNLLFLFILGYSNFTMANIESKTIYGYAEPVILVQKGIILSAKLDTGAKSASLNAINIKKKNNKNVVVLEYDVPYKSKLIHFISPFLGYVSIKPRINELSFSSLKKLISIKRPLTELEIKLGDTKKIVKVNLTNRKHFNYPLLLGRDAINKFDALVDPSIHNSISVSMSARSDAK